MISLKRVKWVFNPQDYLDIGFTHAQVPTPYVMDDRIRVFISGRVDKISHVFSLDISPPPDFEIISINKDPVFLPNKNIGTFDAAVIVSAIEHFGLNTYGEGKIHEYYDVIAMRYIYDLLKPGGTCYLTTPFGGKFVVHKPHWRVYDWANLLERIVQDFRTEVFNLGVCEDITINGNVFPVGSPISMNEAILNTIGLPHISCYLRLRKPLD